jgi:hypothetical protein
MIKLVVIFCLCLLSVFVKAQTTILFSGITWNVRSGGGGPGPNSWSNSPNSVWVDTEEQLHMKIRKEGNTWYCSEVYAQKSFGHGEYRFYVSSNVETYDPETVVGLFTYETDTREIDIEFSRWGNPANVDGWYTVQPVVAGNQQSFALNLAGDNSTHKFTWESSSIFYQSYHGHYTTLPSTDSLIKEWNYYGNYIPPVGNERLHINFWLFGGHVPTNQQDAELVIKAVFVPSANSVTDLPDINHSKISPNPFSDIINIELPENSNDCFISISNPGGQEIFREFLTRNYSDIDLSKLASGLYFVKLVYNQHVEVIKIIKD